MSIKKIWGSRVKTNAATYIADNGLLFYDEVDGELRLGNGVTPGGTAIAVRADLITAQRLLPGADNNNTYGLGDETHRWYDLHIGDGGVYYNGFASPQLVPYLPGAQASDIVPALDNNINLGATDKRFSNIYLGYQGLFLADETTDENINITVNEGTLYIDGAENLRLGNLAIRDTTLTSANNTLDISIGDAGDTGFFYVKRKAQIDNTTFSSTQAMLGINASGVDEPTTIFPDTLVQTTGRPDKNSRIVQRSYGSTGTVGGDNSYAVWASYAARGSVTAPAALKANDILMRLSGNGYGTSTWGSGGARIEYVALENFTDSAKGTKINFWTTPAGQIASQTVASINSVGIVTAGVEFGDETVQTTAGIPLTQKAVPSAAYVATLGVDGKLDASQIPSSLSGAVVFKGVWNANTNTPALSDTTPAGLIAGWEYIVEVGGTRDIGDGSKVFVSGDFVIFDGTHWKQVPSGNLFTSLTGGGGITVNQSTGAITLGSTATPLSNVSTIVSRDSSGNFAANMITANLTGVVTGSVSGNAGSVTNGVYTNGSYANPAWITSLDYSKLSGTVPTIYSSVFIGTTSVAFNRSSGALSLAGVSIDGNAGSVTNGVYTTDTGTVTNTMLAGSIANNKLANSTISGIALGSNLAALTIDGYLIGTSYNGSTGITISVDATTAGTANKVVARDANAIVAGSNFQGTVRDAGAVGGGTLTLNFNSDSIVKCTTASSFTIAYSNITAGRNITVLITNTSAGGGNETATLGVDEGNCTTGTDAGGVATCTLANNSLTVLNIYSIGTTTADVYVGAIPGTT
jgi:hypothetical protein